MIRLIIFDMDGLMIDTERITMQAYLDMGRRWGLPVTKDQFLSIIGKNTPDIKDQYRRDFGEDIDADRLFREIGALRDRRIKAWGMPVKQGLMEVLTMLKERCPDLPLTVASGSDESIIRHHLHLAGIEDYFADCLSSRDVKRGKPAPDVFLALCERFAAAPEETLVFEDSPNGIRAGLAGGMRVIAVPDLIPIPEDLADDCYAVVPDLEAAIPLIEKVTIHHSLASIQPGRE